MTTFNQELTRESAATEAVGDIKGSIKTIAENKGITVENTDTPISVLQKINTGTVATPTGTINITENGTTDVTNYASANVNVVSTSKLPQVVDKTITSLTAEDLAGATKIGDYAFRSCSRLTEITIPSSVTSIGTYAFYGCNSLTEITIPNSVTRIYDYAFESCTSLINITIPNSVTSIGNSAFFRCTSLTGPLAIPNSVTRIGSSAFYNCTSLINITIPNSVTSIGGSAFSDCSSLTSVVYEGQAPNISSNTFYGCNSVQRYDFRNCTSIPTLYSVASLGHASGCEIIVPDALYDAWTTATNWVNLTNVVWVRWVEPTAGLSYSINEDGISASCDGIGTATDTDIVIASEYEGVPVTNIGYAAFDSCAEITNLTIPNSVITIDSYAFSGCTGITTLTISSNITSIGDAAFMGCAGITDLEIQAGITSIGDAAFDGCSGLTNVTIPSSVISIGANAFNRCANLTIMTMESSTPPTLANINAISSTTTTIYIPAGSLTAYQTATNWSEFADKFVEQQPTPTEGLAYSINEDGLSATCTGIGTATDTDIVIASEYQGMPVTNIGSEAFKNDTTITSVIFSNSITNIGDSAFWGCIGLIGQLTIPDSVTSVGEFAFQGCTGLTGQLIIPDSVTSIGIHAFANCDNFTSVIIPNSLTSISGYVFADCTRLIGLLTIPNSVTSIGVYAFANCTSLTTMRMESSTPPTLANINAISYATTTIYVPRGSLTAYQTATNWSEFADKFVEDIQVVAI